MQCKIKNCKRGAFRRELCVAHYKLFRDMKNNDPDPQGFDERAVAEGLIAADGRGDTRPIENVFEHLASPTEPIKKTKR